MMLENKGGRFCKSFLKLTDCKSLLTNEKSESHKYETRFWYYLFELTKRL